MTIKMFPKMSFGITLVINEIRSKNPKMVKIL